MRIGIFGGTFDPPHVGHLLAAQDAFEALDLDQLILVPAAAQPLKTAGAVSAERRYQMVSLTFDDPRFTVSRVELDRGGVSFTVDTLAHFAKVHPAAERYLLLGADVLATFDQWREPSRVVELAQPVILERQAGEASLPAGMTAAKWRRLTTRRIDVSSTEIRQRVREGKSIRGFVTESVAGLIERDGLYR